MHISSLCICCRLLCRFASERLKAPLGGLRGAPALLLFGSFGVHPGAGAGEATFWQLHRLHLFCSSFWTSIFVSASCYSIEQYNYSSISCSMKPEPAGRSPPKGGLTCHLVPAGEAICSIVASGNTDQLTMPRFVYSEE